LFTKGDSRRRDEGAILLRIVFDENFNRRVINGLELRLPGLDLVIAQETELKGAKDPAVLAWAANRDRIIVTHDLDTMPKFAYDRIMVGQAMPGVIAVPQDLPIGRAIEDLLTVLECSEPSDFNNYVLYLPL
jgi:predicted nuclease of predicted toxin-antitoxin system